MASVRHLLRSLDPVLGFKEVAEELYRSDMSEWRLNGCKGSPPVKISPGGCQKLVERALKKLETLCVEANIEDWV